MKRSLVFVSGLLLLPLLLSASTCDDEKRTPCSFRQFVLSDEAQVGILTDVHLLKAGPQFILVGLDGTTVRWQQISNTGQWLGGGAFPLPAGALPGVKFTAVGTTASGDQLVAIFRMPAANNVTEVQAITQAKGGTPLEARTLYTSAPGADPDTMVIEATTGTSGLRALVAVGYQGQAGAPVNLYLLGRDGVPDANDRQIDGLPMEWACLRLGFGHTGNSEFSVSFLNLNDQANGGDNELELHRYNEMAQRSGSYTIGYGQFSESHCPLVAPTKKGFVYAWQTDMGTYAGQSSGVSPIYPFSAAYWGGVAQQPRLIGALGAGNNTGLLFLPRSGNLPPKVKLVNYQAHEIGAELILPNEARGLIGTPSVVTTPDGFHVTYRERQSTTLNTGPRHLVSVECSDR